jgi:hypothetical protein
MKAIFVGALGAALGVALFLAGLFTGATIYRTNTDYALDQARASATQESAQMQCIHWVDKWRTAPQFQSDPGMPTFGMYTTLCGKPDSK